MSNKYKWAYSNVKLKNSLHSNIKFNSKFYKWFLITYCFVFSSVPPVSGRENNEMGPRFHTSHLEELHQEEEVKCFVLNSCDIRLWDCVCSTNFYTEQAKQKCLFFGNNIYFRIFLIYFLKESCKKEW